jgi:hypothetical protein
MVAIATHAKTSTTRIKIAIARHVRVPRSFEPCLNRTWILTAVELNAGLVEQHGALLKFQGATRGKGNASGHSTERL